MPAATLLEITGIPLGDYAARGLTMELTPIENGALARDWTGELHDLTLAQFRKYHVVIACSDLQAPELTGVWRGTLVHLKCLPDVGVIADDTAGGELEFDAMVVSWHTTRDEWGVETGWQIELLQK